MKHAANGRSKHSQSKRPNRQMDDIRIDRRDDTAIFWILVGAMLFILAWFATVRPQFSAYGIGLCLKIMCVVAFTASLIACIYIRHVINQQTRILNGQGRHM